MSVKSSLVAISAAVVVAVLVTALKDRAALQERFGLSNKTTPELMMVGRLKADTPPAQPIDIQAVSDKIQAVAPAGAVQQLAQATPPVAVVSQPVPAIQPAPVFAAPSPVVEQAASQSVSQQVQTPQVQTQPAQAQPVQAQSAQQPAVDESALRYFASRGDKVRLQAEISRLQALYPNWTPPADPLAVPQNGDKQLEAMWQLYSDGRYAELRKAISDRQGTEAGWQPPADLLDRLDVAEARARLVNASDLKQYATVVDIAAQTPSLLTCSEVDVLWRVAEAFVDTNREQRGQDAYAYILKNCTNPAERLATLQKASGLLPYQPMQALLALEKPAADGSREFDSVRDDLSRSFVAEGNADPKLTISGDYITRVEKLAETQGLATDALLLGWYQLRRNNMAEAEKWFRAALAKEDSASGAQGLSLALVARKSPQEAEDVMYKWRGDSKDATATYLAATANLMALQPPANLSEEVLGRIASEIIAQKYVPTAQQFGWYARSLNQFQTAARWFETALRWKPDDEPSAYGLVITREQLNDRKGVAEVQRLWAGHSDRIARLDDTSSLTPNEPLPLPGPDMVTHQQPASLTPSSLTPTLLQAAPLTNQAPLVPQQSLAPRQLVAPQRSSYVQPAQMPQQQVAIQRPLAPTVVRSAPPAVYAAAPASAMNTVRVNRTARQPRGCVTTVNADLLDPADALTRGWCLMDINRPMEAAAAFEAALGSPVRKTREDAAYGQSLAYLRAGLSNNAAVAATKAPQTRQRAAELQVSILADRALAAFDAKRYRETLIFLDQRAQLQQERVDLMILRGYCYLNLKMFEDATRVFEAAALTGNRDAVRGLSDVRSSTHPDVVD